MAKKKKKEITIRSSATEYLTFIAVTGDDPQSFEMRYEDEKTSGLRKKCWQHFMKWM